MAYGKVSGIYAINCTATKKVYIGSAVSVRQRLAAHRSMLERDGHTNKHLQNAYAKYGAESFVMEMIEACDVDELIEREQVWIDYYNAADPEFGMNNSATASTSLGFRHSEASKARLSEIAKARDNSHLKKNSDAMRGKPGHNKGKPGKKWTDEQKALASAARKGMKAWNKGIPHTEEVKKRISATLTLNRRTIPDEVRGQIKQLRADGKTYSEISKLTGVSLSQCAKIQNDIHGRDYRRSQPEVEPA